LPCVPARGRRNASQRKQSRISSEIVIWNKVDAFSGSRVFVCERTLVYMATIAEKMSEVPDIQIDEMDLQQRNKSDSISSGNRSDSEDEKTNASPNQIRLIPRPPKQESYDSVSSNGEEDEVELTDELREKIIEQAEFYFSNENLKKDGFLLKHVKRNKEGFVNLKLLASFKKMRSLSRDYRVIGEALKASTRLIINESGLKVRRVDPLPKDLLDQARVKNLVVSNIPHENPSMDYVISAFPGHKDDISSVRVVKPGKKIPTDLQSHFSRHPELKDQIVAVVEFESPEGAAAAMQNVDKNTYSGMIVKLLELSPKQAKRMSTGDSATASDTPMDSDSAGVEKKSKKKGGNRLLEVNGGHHADDSYNSSSDSNSDWSSFSSCSKRYSRSHGGSKSNSPSTSPKNRSPIEMYTPRSKSNERSPQKKRIDHSPARKMSPLATNENPRCSPDAAAKKQEGEKLNPWMVQRMQQHKLTKNNSENDSSSMNTHKHLEVIRQPKGPDGSFGFSNHPLKKYVLVHAY